MDQIGERVQVHVVEFGELMQVWKGRVMWIELSFRKLNLMGHRGERTRSGCVFIDVSFLKKRGYVKKWGNNTWWTMNNGGRATWREWEMGGEVAGSGERKLILLLDRLLPHVFILFCKICVGPFQTTVWVIPRHARIHKKAGIFFFLNYFFPLIFFFFWNWKN